MVAAARGRSQRQNLRLGADRDVRSGNRLGRAVLPRVGGHLGRRRFQFLRLDPPLREEAAQRSRQDGRREHQIGHQPEHQQGQHQQAESPRRHEGADAERRQAEADHEAALIHGRRRVLVSEAGRFDPVHPHPHGRGETKCRNAPCRPRRPPSPPRRSSSCRCRSESRASQACRTRSPPAIPSESSSIGRP